MAAAKKTNALQVVRTKLQDTQKKLASNRKESQLKIKSLKDELKEQVSKAMKLGYEKGLTEAFKEKEKYLQAREKAILNAISQFNKKFKSKVKPKKTTVKKASPKKSVIKKAAPKRTMAKKAAPKKVAMKKSAPKKATVKKVAVKKAAAKKSMPKKKNAKK